MSDKTYQQMVERGAKIMARILRHTPAKTTTVHALAEDGPLSPDLFAQIQKCATEHPDQDIIVYVQRINIDVLRNGKQ